MPNANVKIDYNIEGLERIRENLEESKLTAKLGIFGDKNKRDDKMSEELAKAYGELEKKMSAPQQEEQPTESVEENTQPEEVQQLDK